jgi:hypothetical protein
MLGARGGCGEWDRELGKIKGVNFVVVTSMLHGVLLRLTSDYRYMNWKMLSQNGVSDLPIAMDVIEDIPQVPDGVVRSCSIHAFLEQITPFVEDGAIFYKARFRDESTVVLKYEESERGDYYVDTTSADGASVKKASTWGWDFTPALAACYLRRKPFRTPTNRFWAVFSSQTSSDNNLRVQWVECTAGMFAGYR